MANNNHAHCRSGTRGSMSRNTRSVATRFWDHVCTKSEWPMGVPKTRRPRSWVALSEHQTPSPSAATLPGAGSPVKLNARVLPRLAAMPQCAAMAPVTVSSARRAPGAVVTT